MKSYIFNGKSCRGEYFLYSHLYVRIEANNMKRNLKNIYYNFDEGHYGLKVVFDLDEVCLLFDSISFIYVDASVFDEWKHWDKLEYKELEKNTIHITEIKEDELTSYFVKLSNMDIFYIYQQIELEDSWYQNFILVSPKEDNYNEVVEHMEEDWVETVVPEYRSR